MLNKEFIIPSCEGRIFTVKKGQLLRIIEVEGEQAADVIIFNEHDMKESFSTWLTRHNSGCFTKAKYLYSKLPAMNIMFTVLTEKDGMFWLSPGRCNRYFYEQRNAIKDHKNCQDILAELIKPYGLTPWDVPEVLNIFMNAAFQQDGTYELIAPPVSKGDYMELLAEMDCLVGVSACPSDRFGWKPLGIQILN